MLNLEGEDERTFYKGVEGPREGLEKARETGKSLNTELSELTERNTTKTLTILRKMRHTTRSRTNVETI